MMNKFKEFFNRNFGKYRYLINWDELGWSMVIFFSFFVVITIGMVLTNTWGFGGKEMNLFLGFGFVLGLIINLIKQFK